MIEPTLYAECIRTVIKCLEDEMCDLEIDRFETEKAKDGFKTARAFKSARHIRTWENASSLRTAIFYLWRNEGLHQLLEGLALFRAARQPNFSLRPTSSVKSSAFPPSQHCSFHPPKQSSWLRQSTTTWPLPMHSICRSGCSNESTFVTLRTL